MTLSTEMSAILEALLWHVGGDHPDHEQSGKPEVEDGRELRLAGRAAEAHRLDRPPDRAAVEDPDRGEVDQVEQEADVAERLEHLGLLLLADQPDEERADAAPGRPRVRDPEALPRVHPCVADRHVGAEEGDEDGPRRVEPAPPRLDEVPKLVDEDQQHEADAELPAPEQRVAADRDEDRRELREGEAELEDQPDQDGDRRPELACERAPGRLRVDRAVLALGKLGMLHAYGISTGRPSASIVGPEKMQSTWIVASLSPPYVPVLRPIATWAVPAAFSSSMTWPRGVRAWFSPIPSSAITSAPSPASSTMS